MQVYKENIVVIIEMIIIIIFFFLYFCSPEGIKFEKKNSFHLWGLIKQRYRAPYDIY